MQYRQTDYNVISARVKWKGAYISLPEFAISLVYSRQYPRRAHQVRAYINRCGLSALLGQPDREITSAAAQLQYSLAFQGTQDLHEFHAGFPVGERKFRDDISAGVAFNFTYTFKPEHNT
jgi:hypothetical protein